MTSLRSKIIASLEQKAKAADLMAEQHDAFGPTRYGREYRQSAREYRSRATFYRNGGEFRPTGYAV